MNGVTDTALAYELEVGSFIGLWLQIHGGDPPETPAQVAAIVGQIIANLSTFAFGEAVEVSTGAIKSRLAALNVQLKQVAQAAAQAGRGGSSNVAAPDAQIVQGGQYNEIIWPGVPGGPPIIVKVPHETHT